MVSSHLSLPLRASQDLAISKQDQAEQVLNNSTDGQHFIESNSTSRKWESGITRVKVSSCFLECDYPCKPKLLLDLLSIEHLP